MHGAATIAPTAIKPNAPRYSEAGLPPGEVMVMISPSTPTAKMSPPATAPMVRRTLPI
jgi:hypothetical protein